MRILGAFVIVVALVGCAQDLPVVEPDETAAPAVELVEVDQPAQVFDGDCSAIFTDEALSTALGQQVTESGQLPVNELWPIADLEPQEFLVENAGGLHCTWVAPTTMSVLFVAALPAAAVNAPEDVDCIATDMSPTSCPIDVTANGIRLAGQLASDIEGADPLARVAAVEALFAANATAAVAPVTQTPLAGAWPTPVDCGDFAASVDWASIGEPALQADEFLGSGAYASAVEFALRGDRVLSTCSLLSDSRDMAFSHLGGGAWMRDAVLAQDGAAVVDVPGFDLVIERAEAGTIDIFDGVNWLHANDWGDASAMYPLLSAVVDALDAAA